MAIVECWECKNEISSFATLCPNCGAPPHGWEVDEMFENIEGPQEESVKQIQNSFNRIHDKLFSFNSVFLAASLVLATFPKESPVVPLWAIAFPVANLLLLIFLEYRQMEIHRFASKTTFLLTGEDEKYDRLNRNQSLRSLFSIITTIAVLLYIAIQVYCYLYH